MYPIFGIFLGSGAVFYGILYKNICAVSRIEHGEMCWISIYGATTAIITQYSYHSNITILSYHYSYHQRDQSNSNHQKKCIYSISNEED